MGPVLRAPGPFILQYTDAPFAESRLPKTAEVGIPDPTGGRTMSATLSMSLRSSGRGRSRKSPAISSTARRAVPVFASHIPTRNPTTTALRRPSQAGARSGIVAISASPDQQQNEEESDARSGALDVAFVRTPFGRRFDGFLTCLGPGNRRTERPAGIEWSGAPCLCLTASQLGERPPARSSARSSRTVFGAIGTRTR